MKDICLSPRHIQAVNECSPSCTIKRKNLFPSDSPQSLDIGFISSLTPSPEVYSPPNWSDLSENNSRQSLVLSEVNFDDILYDIDKQTKPDHFMKEDGEFRSVLNGIMTPGNINFCSEFKEKKTPIGICTFPINSKLHKHFGSIKETQLEPAVIKPVNFYGTALSQSASNHSILSQNNKRIRYLPHQSKVKTKSFSDNRSVNEKRDRSHSNDSSKRRTKRMKEIYSGVHHRILKPKQKNLNHHIKSVRSKTKIEVDFSRPPYVVFKKFKTGWEYPGVVIKPERVEAGNSEKRKFFKTVLKESPVLSLSTSPGLKKKKKRNLYNYSSDFENKVSSVNTSSRNVSDMFAIIEDGVNEKEIDMEQKHVEDLISHVENEGDETGTNRQEIRELINSFHEIEESEEDSENKCPNSSVTNLTASTATVTLNSTTEGFGCSKRNGKEMSDLLFPIFTHNYKFKKVLAHVTNEVKLQNKNVWRPMGNDQYQIDAGQKKFGEKQCSECGLLYQQGDPDDEIEHNVCHTNFHTLRFMGWKNENIAGCYGADKVIVIRWNDPKIWHMKCASIFRVVDKELGIMSDSLIASNMKVFLYISEKQVIGCLVGISLSRAHKLLASTSDMTTCSEESYPVKCGICRLWTHTAYRRRGIASKLVDTLRLNFVHGYILTRDDIAFSIPTPDGKSFAIKYVGKSDFCVFTGY